jgi:hypothetical protein
MSDLSRRSDREEENPESGHPHGPNLVLIYALLVFGLLAAAVIAAMIVWPFYVRR